jgi:hypothetical protein
MAFLFFAGCATLPNVQISAEARALNNFKKVNSIFATSQEQIYVFMNLRCPCAKNHARWLKENFEQLSQRFQFIFISTDLKTSDQVADNFFNFYFPGQKVYSTKNTNLIEDLSIKTASEVYFADHRASVLQKFPAETDLGMTLGLIAASDSMKVDFKKLQSATSLGCDLSSLNLN